MTYILVLWTVIATNSGYANTDWRPIAEFQSHTLCEQAATAMNVRDRYRCIQIK
jgi:hypothetical protein